LFSTHENGSPSAAAAGATNKEMIMNWRWASPQLKKKKNKSGEE
jgi:hypothetical protein